MVQIVDPPDEIPNPPIRRLFDPNWKMIPDTVRSTQAIESDDVTNTIPDGMVSSEMPKLKFNFTVQFKFRGENEARGSQDPYQNHFAVIKVGRPQPTINYVKANFYNFRTNVATNVDYGSVNIQFYDDPANRAHSLFENYFETVSPIFNYKNDRRANVLDRLGHFDASQTTRPVNPDVPVNPLGVEVVGRRVEHTASLGEIPSRHGPIVYLKVFHQYVITPEGSSDPVRRTTTYTYLNPKIISANLEDLDMTQSAVSIIDLTFNYDSVFVKHTDE